MRSAARPSSSNAELRTREEQLSDERAAVARLRGDLEEIQGEFAASRQLSEVSEIVEGRLLAAQQELTEEMKRLQDRQHRRPPDDAIVGGIPVDSEYVIFIIDTSGSMMNYAWPTVVRKMSEVLDVYPKVKGLQVMNDMGQYMFSHYAGKWIPDTPAAGEPSRNGSRAGTPFRTRPRWRGSPPPSGPSPAATTGSASMSSATSSRDRPSTRWSRPSIGSTPRTPAAYAPVRIHAIGFPTVFRSPAHPTRPGVKFATLMRILCRRNGGTFVGLSTLD